MDLEPKQPGAEDALILSTRAVDSLLRLGDMLSAKLVGRQRSGASSIPQPGLANPGRELLSLYQRPGQPLNLRQKKKCLELAGRFFTAAENSEGVEEVIAAKQVFEANLSDADKQALDSGAPFSDEIGSPPGAPRLEDSPVLVRRSMGQVVLGFITTPFRR